MAGDLKPSDEGLQREIDYILNASYGWGANGEVLFNGEVGTAYNNGTAFYFDSTTSVAYIDISLNEKCNIWCHSNPSCADNNACYLYVFKYINEEWVDITESTEQHGRKKDSWSLCFPNLPKGRYKFTLNDNIKTEGTTGGFRTDDEWYLEYVQPKTAYLLQDNKTGNLFSLFKEKNEILNDKISTKSIGGRPYSDEIFDPNKPLSNEYYWDDGGTEREGFEITLPPNTTLSRIELYSTDSYPLTDVKFELDKRVIKEQDLVSQCIPMIFEGREVGSVLEIVRYGMKDSVIQKIVIYGSTECGKIIDTGMKSTTEELYKSKGINDITTLNDVFEQTVATREGQSVDDGKIFEIEIPENTNEIKSIETIEGLPLGGKCLFKDGEGNLYEVSKHFEESMENAIPPMTSNTSPSGEASSNLSSINTQEPWKAFNHSNRNYVDGWVGQARRGILQYKFDKPKIIYKYIVEAYSTSGSNISAKSWVFQGSNDGTNWEHLHTVEYFQGYKIGGNVNKPPRETYEIENNKPYLYYRLNISSTHTSMSMRPTVALGEVEMYEMTPKGYGIKKIGQLDSDTFKNYGTSDISMLDLEEFDLLEIMDDKGEVGSGHMYSVDVNVDMIENIEFK